MPTVLRVDGYRFFFYSGDSGEPVHVHVERAGGTAKVWVDPVRLERSRGFSTSEITVILGLVGENRALIVRQWNEFFES